MYKRSRDLMLDSIAKRIRVEFHAPSALNAILVVALERLDADQSPPRDPSGKSGIAPDARRLPLRGVPPKLG